MELEFPDDENEGSYADPQTQDEEQMDMDIYYQPNIDDIGLGGDVKDQIARIEASKNSEADLTDSYLGDRMHEQNVSNLEEISDNLEVLQRVFNKAMFEDDTFLLYQYAIAEKLKFLEIINKKVFEKLKNRKKMIIKKSDKKIEIIKGLVKKLELEKSILKTGSFIKNIVDRIQRLYTDLKTIENDKSEINNYFNKEEKKFEKFKANVTSLKNKNRDENFSIQEYRQYLDDIFNYKNEKERLKTTVDLSNMSVKETKENFLLKPINEGLKLHNSIFHKYKTDTDYEYSQNIYKRYNLLENLNILKTSSKEHFFQIMGKFKLTEHMISLITIDKKHRRIIYDNAISLISSFVPNNLIDNLLENTSLYIKEKYIVGFEYINSNYFPSNQFENKVYDATRFISKGKEKERESKTYAPVLGWIYKEDALKNIHNLNPESDTINKIKEGKQKFIKGKLEDIVKNDGIHFVERGNLPENTNVKIQIINGSIEPWRKRYLKHKILLNQVNEKKLYTLSNLKLPQNTKPEKYINENILEKMAENDIKQIYEEMDNKEQIKKYLKDIVKGRRKEYEEKIKDCGYKNLSKSSQYYNTLETQIQFLISERNNLLNTRKTSDSVKDKIDKIYKQIIELKKEQQDVIVPTRVGYISQISSIVDKRKENKMMKSGDFKRINGLFFDTRLPNYNRVLNFKLPKNTKDQLKKKGVKLNEIRLIERKLLLDELTIKKISNTINYKKFDIEDFKRFPKRHTSEVVGRDVKSIIKSFQKELPTGFYTEDKENIKKQLKKVLNNGKCSKDVKEFLLKKVVPIKGSRYNFSKILEDNKNRRSRNYYNKYLKDKYDTYEEYEEKYIQDQKTLFNRVANRRRLGASFLRLKKSVNSGEYLLVTRDPISKELVTSFKIPENLDEKGIREWFEKYFDIFPATKKTEGLVQDTDYFMRDSLYVDDLRKEKIKALPARNIQAGYMKRIGYIVNWVSNKQTFQFNFERHELISFLFCRVQFMMNNSNINNVTKQKRLLIVLKILYYLQENINNNTIQFFIDFENEVEMDLCTGEEFSKDTMSKIVRLIGYCEDQIEEFNITIEEKLNDIIKKKLIKIDLDKQISKNRFRKFLDKDGIPEKKKFINELERISELDEPMPFQSTVTGESRRPLKYETRRGGPNEFEPKRTISPFTKARNYLERKWKNVSQEKRNRINRNANKLYKNLLTRYKQDSKEKEYRQVLEKTLNVRPKMSDYEKEYIRLWNLSGSTRKNIITDVEKRIIEKLELNLIFCFKDDQIEIFRELCKNVIIPLMKNNKNQEQFISKIFDLVFIDISGIGNGIRYNDKFLNRNIELFEDMKRGVLPGYSNVPIILLEEYKKFNINNFILLREGKFPVYKEILREKKKVIKGIEELVNVLTYYRFKKTYNIVEILIRVIKKYKKLSRINDITDKDIIINVIKKSLAKMSLEEEDMIKYHSIVQDLNKNGLKNFKILKNKVDNNTFKEDLENYKKSNTITNTDIGLCILKQVELVHSEKDDDDLFDDFFEEDEGINTPIDISKGVEFYLNEVKGEVFKTTTRPAKDLKKPSIKKDNIIRLIDSIKGSILTKEAYFIPSIKYMKGMGPEISYLIDRAKKFQRENNTIELYKIKLKYTFNSIEQFKDFLVSHLNYPRGIEELRFMYNTEMDYEIDTRARLFGKKKRKVKKKHKVKKKRKIKKKKKSKK